MNLLILTQKVDHDDPILGFFCRWVTEFAKHCEQVTVICLSRGEYSLPGNVRVLSLGKEDGVSRLRYAVRFFRYIWQERKNYDNVFVHMNHIYVVLGAVLWRMMGKCIALWYAHGHVPQMLRLAKIGAHIIVTSTESGFRLQSKKVHVVGQGIDTAQFDYCYVPQNEGEELRLVSVGRISPIKHYETLIRAVEALKKRGITAHVTIIGGIGLPSQEVYKQELEELVRSRALKKQVHFTGAIPNTEIREHLCSAHAFINPSQTGSLDKAGLEAMAVGLPVLTCNEAYAGVLEELRESLMFASGDAEGLAEKLVTLTAEHDMTEVSHRMRRIVQEKHSVTRLIPRILQTFHL